MAANYAKGEEVVPGFVLLDCLGRGGFGEVWKVLAPGGTEAAIKIISLNNKLGRKEFRSIQLVKRIRHPNLLPTYALWIRDAQGNVHDASAVDPSSAETWSHQAPGLASSQQGIWPTQLLIAMGLGDKNLFDRLQECVERDLVGIPPNELLNYMEDAAKAIDYLNSPRHDLGYGPVAIQHCDIKPQNILIVGGAAQLCDFGLARTVGEIRKSDIPATFAYAAPEYIEKHASPTSDQYSLAISYIELRTGSLPFGEESLGKVMTAHLEGKLDSSQLPLAEQAVFRRATARNPSQRFPSACEMVQALRSAQQGGRPFITIAEESSSSTIDTPPAEPAEPMISANPEAPALQEFDPVEREPDVDISHEPTPEAAESALFELLDGDELAAQQMLTEDENLTPSLTTTDPHGVSNSETQEAVTSLHETGEMGESFAHRFQLADLIHQGSFGRFYRARYKERDRMICLELLPRDLSLDETQLRRFLRALRRATRVRHPNIARVYRAGRYKSQWWVALEYVDGISARTLIEQNAKGLPAARVVAMARDLADGLQVAHRNNLVHGSIKPDHILLNQAGVVKLNGFPFTEISVLDNLQRESSQPKLAHDITYIAPECIKHSKRMDYRCDLYSLAASMYTLLTGCPPFTGEVARQLIEIRGEMPISLRRLNPHVPRELEEIVMTCLAKRPRDRFESVAQLHDALSRLL